MSEVPADGGARRSPTVEEVFAIQPGLARLMPEVGNRFWKCWYAAEAGNWPLASWQLRECRKLLRLGNFTRPKYTEDVDAFISAELQPLEAALDAQDFAAFDAAYATAVVRANDYHDKWNKGYIVWKRPELPPPDLDLTPRPPKEG